MDVSNLLWMYQIYYECVKPMVDVSNLLCGCIKTIADISKLLLIYQTYCGCIKSIVKFQIRYENIKRILKVSDVLWKYKIYCCNGIKCILVEVKCLNYEVSNVLLRKYKMYCWKGIRFIFGKVLTLLI